MVSERTEGACVVHMLFKYIHAGLPSPTLPFTPVATLHHCTIPPSKPLLLFSLQPSTYTGGPMAAQLYASAAACAAASAAAAAAAAASVAVASASAFAA